MTTYGSVASGRRIVEVEKGALRQGVAPTLARVRPNASARRVVHDPRKVIGKGSFSIPAEHIARGGAAGRAQLRGAAAAADSEHFARFTMPKKAPKPAGYPFKDLAGKPTLPATGGRIKGNVGKAAPLSPMAQAAMRRKLAAGAKQESTRVTEAWSKAKAPVAKALSPLSALGSARSGAKAGLGGWKDPAKSIGMGRAAQGANRIGRLGGQGAALAMTNPKTASALGGGAAGAGLLAGVGRRDKPMAPMTPPSLYGGMAKRSYDPEGERRFRQGAAGAALGLGGAELGRRTASTVRADTARTRDLVGRKGAKLSNAQAEQAREVARLARLKSVRGVTLSRKGALQAGGATALLGASGALFRNRNEPRWD